MGSARGRKREGYFNVQRSKHPAAQHSVAENKRTLDLLLGCTVQHDLAAEDLHTLAEQIAAYTVGLYSAYQLEDALGFCARLHRELGGLKSHARAVGVVSLRHMLTIERALRRLEEPLSAPRIAQLDAALIRKFTATVPNQIVPTPGEIRRWLEELLRRWGIEDGATVDAQIPAEAVQVMPSLTPGMSMVTAELTDLDAHAFMERVEAHAKERDISKGKALVELVCQTSNVADIIQRRVIFGVGNLKPGMEVDTSWVYGIGPVSKEQRKILNSVPVDYVNIADIAKQCRATHDPSMRLKMTVHLRDIICRFPGCNVPAHLCDIDHVINHEAGGWTTLSNLQCLCRHHHNAKTDRRVRATMTTAGHVTWTRADGTLIGTTVPQGPLAGIEGIVGGITTRHSGKTEKDDNTAPPINNGLGRWGYTLEQKNNRIRRRHQQAKQLAKQYADSAKDPPPKF